jgi:hypothetical protein
MLALTALFVGIVLLSIWAHNLAKGDEEHLRQGHPPEDRAIHEQFYSHWMQKNGKQPCCGGQDCYPTAARFNPVTGLWEALRREDKKWVTIPKGVYDAQNPYEIRSPDGRAHLCAPSPANTDWLWENLFPGVPKSDLIYCFTPGGETS